MSHAGSPTSSKSIFDPLLDLLAGKIVRLRWLAFSTIGAAVSSFMVGKTHGWWLVLPITGVVAFGLLTASIAAARDRLSKAEKLEAAEKAEAAAQEVDKVQAVAERLWGTIHSAGVPLLRTLGDINMKKSAESGIDQRTAMIVQVLEFTRRRLGQDPADNRAVFYERVNADTLTLIDWRGRGHPPRHKQWLRHGDRLARTVHEFLDEDDPLFQDYPDIREDPPRGCNPHEASYRSFLTVRVEAGGERFGLLSVDSPRPKNFTLRDRNALSLLSGLLAAGIAAAKQD